MNSSEVFKTAMMIIASVLIAVVSNMFIWNYLMPDLFGLKQITFWQSFWMMILAYSLFK